VKLYVLTGDHSVRDPEKPGGHYGPDDLRLHQAMAEAITSLEPFQVEIINRHEHLLERLRAEPPDLLVNFCDTGYRNQSALELHIPAYCEMLGVHYTGSPPIALATCYDKALVRRLAQSLRIPVPWEIFLAAGSSTVPSDLLIFSPLVSTQP